MVYQQGGDWVRNTDKDGVMDHLDDDIDGDGVDNFTEVMSYSDQFSSTHDPQVDSDSDGLPDMLESSTGWMWLSDPLFLDTDNDGLSDLKEFYLGTTLNAEDTDGDGVSDKEEVNGGTNPLVRNGVSVSTDPVNVSIIPGATSDFYHIGEIDADYGQVVTIQAEPIPGFSMKNVELFLGESDWHIEVPTREELGCEPAQDPEEGSTTPPENEDGDESVNEGSDKDETLTTLEPDGSNETLTPEKKEDSDDETPTTPENEDDGGNTPVDKDSEETTSEVSSANKEPEVLAQTGISSMIPALIATALLILGGSAACLSRRRYTFNK